jgi:hypothetical protein
MNQGCGKPDNNGKVVSGAPLLCGTHLYYGVGKEIKKVEVHLCTDCTKKGGK